MNSPNRKLKILLLAPQLLSGYFPAALASEWKVQQTGIAQRSTAQMREPQHLSGQQLRGIQDRKCTLTGWAQQLRHWVL